MLHPGEAAAFEEDDVSRRRMAAEPFCRFLRRAEMQALSEGVRRNSVRNPGGIRSHADDAVKTELFRRAAHQNVPFLGNAPSSPILPSTAKRLPVQESPATVCRAACMESGLAL